MPNSLVLAVARCSLLLQTDQRDVCVLKATFHYTDPTGPARTRTDFVGDPHGPTEFLGDPGRSGRAGPCSGI